MSETKSLTLDEVRLIIEGHKENRSTPAEAMQFDYVLSILARVEQPSEEDMAVLWLMKCPDTWTKTIGYDDENDVWYALYLDDESKPGVYVLKLINPAEEAMKLGWKKDV